MNKLDIIIAIPLAWGLIRGIMKGLIHELSTFIALGLGIYGSLKLGAALEQYMREDLSFTSSYTSLFAFTLVFIAILVLVFFCGKIAEKFIKATPLGIVNNVAGALFGMLKFALIIGALFLVIEKAEQHKLSLITKETKENSLLYTPVYSLSEMLYSKIE